VDPSPPLAPQTDRRRPWRARARAAFVVVGGAGVLVLATLLVRELILIRELRRRAEQDEVIELRSVRSQLPQVGSCELVSSTPPGAEVHDGRGLLGVTPMCAPSRAFLSVALAGHHRWSGQATEPLALTLEPFVITGDWLLPDGETHAFERDGDALVEHARGEAGWREVGRLRFDPIDPADMRQPTRDQVTTASQGVPCARRQIRYAELTDPRGRRWQTLDVREERCGEGGPRWSDWAVARRP
jgi:hypothetical protein